MGSRGPVSCEAAAAYPPCDLVSAANGLRRGNVRCENRRPSGRVLEEVLVNAPSFALGYLLLGSKSHRSCSRQRLREVRDYHLPPPRIDRVCGPGYCPNVPQLRFVSSHHYGFHGWDAPSPAHTTNCRVCVTPRPMCVGHSCSLMPMPKEKLTAWSVIPNVYLPMTSWPCLHALCLPPMLVSFSSKSQIRSRCTPSALTFRPTRCALTPEFRICEAGQIAEYERNGTPGQGGAPLEDWGPV